jgi:hypothetical protein
MKLIIYFDNLKNIWSHWVMFYYFPPWCCIVIGSGIKWISSNKTEVDTVAFK